MSKKKINSTFICQECQYSSPKWLGKCPDCGEWNSFLEQDQVQHIPTLRKSLGESFNYAVKIHNVEHVLEKRVSTGISEFDRVLGGGLVEGSLILIGGEPGIGKSTLLSHALGLIAKNNPKQTILYCSGEESVAQISGRMGRLGICGENFLLLNESNWHVILENIKKFKPKYCVIDSIQTTCIPDLTSAPGTLSQVREVTYEIMNYTKALNMSTFLVGHITKDGQVAGPKMLEHMVDAVIYFEGDQFNHYRILRSMKNRFGNTFEVGIFEMGDRGLREIPNPGQYFLDEALKDGFGSSLTCILEGTRALFVEIQALVVENKFSNGQRTTQGIDRNRLSMLVAILEKYFKLPLGLHDIYLNVVGGLKLQSRDTDLAIMASILSSYHSKSLHPKTLYLGEVGLTGEVRTVSMMEHRLKEIQQFQYERVVTAKKVANEFKKKSSCQIIGLNRASELIEYL